MVRLHFSAIASIEKSRPREEINVNNIQSYLPHPDKFWTKLRGEGISLDALIFI